MTCPRCGAALARVEDDSNGWLVVVRAIFSCGHSQYVAAEPGPSREPDRKDPNIYETDRPCAHCHERLGRIAFSHQRVHTSCAPAWNAAQGQRRQEKQRAWRAAQKAKA